MSRFISVYSMLHISKWPMKSCEIMSSDFHVYPFGVKAVNHAAYLPPCGSISPVSWSFTFLFCNTLPNKHSLVRQWLSFIEVNVSPPDARHTSRSDKITVGLCKQSICLALPCQCIDSLSLHSLQETFNKFIINIK